MFNVSTYDIATMGQNSKNTATIASNGILITVLIETIQPPIDFGGGYIPPTGTEYQKVKDIKKITVNVTVGGVKYIETHIVENRPELTVNDIRVEVKETNDKPIINVIIL